MMLLLVLSGVVFSTSIAFAACYDKETHAYVGEPPCKDGSYDDTSGGGNDQITTFAGLLNRVNDILNAVVPFLIGLGVFVIIYGVFGYLTHSADEEKRAEARQFVLWGIIGVFIMLSIWGLISVLTNTFALDTYAPAVDTIFPSPY